MSKAKDEYEKGDYVMTIPLGICKVKARKRDEKSILFYMVRDSSNSRFALPIRLVKREATPQERREYDSRINKLKSVN